MGSKFILVLQPTEFAESLGAGLKKKKRNPQISMECDTTYWNAKHCVGQERWIHGPWFFEESQVEVSNR